MARARRSSGFNLLTGWPDRAPLGPSGTITDSLAPRFVAAALAAALLYRRRTGRAPTSTCPRSRRPRGRCRRGSSTSRCTASSASAAATRIRGRRIHGVFPCAGDDRWVAIVAWTDEEAARLRRGRRRRHRGVDGDADAARGCRDAAGGGHRGGAGAGLRRLPRRSPARATAATSSRSSTRSWARGATSATASGFRATRRDYDRAGPTLGQDTDWVLGDVFGLSTDDRARLAGRRVRVADSEIRRPNGRGAP